MSQEKKKERRKMWLNMKCIYVVVLCSDHEVYIVSLENLASPQVFCPGAPGENKHKAEITW